MTVLLRHSRELPPAAGFDRWLTAASAIGWRGTTTALPTERKFASLGARLEAAFNDVCPAWWRLAKSLADGPGAELSSAVTAAAYGSDLGMMMAWGRLTENLAGEPARTLVICDDPWLFRHLAMIPGVDAGRMPPLWPAAVRLAVRGWMARLVLVLRLAWSVLATRGQRAHHSPGDSAILVYGHPRSDAGGQDDYFGPMMKEIAGLKRALHADCRVARARALADDRRTASLHAWGRVGWAFGLLSVRWQPRAEDTRGQYGWLVRRAAAFEGGGGAHAMTTWQRLCQEAWLAENRPRVVAWPWENHGWERALCRAARRLGIRTVGYQHTVIGPHQLNYSPATNVDGIASLPEVIVCDGPAYRDQLLEWGVPSARLVIGGSLRIGRSDGGHFDATAPVFVALSARREVAREQIRAVVTAAAEGFEFVVKEHPMYPIAIAETGKIRRAQGGLANQRRIRAVFYATGTSGLEALLAGLPTFRLLPENAIAVDVLPSFVAAETVTVDGLVAALRRARKPMPVPWERVLADVDWPLWRRLFAGEDVARPDPRRRERIA